MQSQINGSYALRAQQKRQFNTPQLHEDNADLR